MIAKQYEQSEHIIVPPWVKYIPKYTFWRTGYGDTILKSVVLPEGVERIDEAAFRSCSNLESITIPNSVRYLGRACFEFCSNLRAISLPDGLKCLEENLFYYCRALEKVRVPKSVIEISPKAFHNCPNVTIYTPSGSYAEQFAKENGIPVVAEDSICD